MSTLFPFLAVAGGAYLVSKKITSTPVVSNPSNPPQPSVSKIKKTVPHLTAKEALAEAMQIEGNDYDPRDLAQILSPAALEQIVNMVTYYTTPQQAQLIGKDPLSSARPVPQQPGGKMTLVTTGAGLALGVATLAVGHAVSVAGGAAAVSGTALGAASSAIPFIGIGIAGIVGIYSIIHAHHQAAVQQEQQIYYSANPAAFDYFRVIRVAVATGQSSPQEGIHALDSLQADYEKTVAPSVKHNPCNANCEGLTRVRAIVIYWKAYYNDMIIQGANQ